MTVAEVINLVLGVINLIAIIVIPIIAIIIGQKLQDRAKKRDDKMYILKTLMTARIYGWTTDSVHSLNIIDIVFAEDESVRIAWERLYNFYCTHTGKGLSEDEVIEAVGLNNKLIEKIAKSIGYKEEIVISSIEKPYKPDGMVKAMQSQATAQENYNNMIEKLTILADQQVRNAKSQQEGVDNKEKSNG